MSAHRQGAEPEPARCPGCGTRPAILTLTRIVGDRVETRELCDSCATAAGLPPEVR